MTRADAHPALPTVAILKVTPDARISVTLVHDALAYALNDTSVRVADPDMLALLNGPEQDLADAFADAGERIVGGFELEADGRRVVVHVAAAPSVEAARAWKRDFPSMPLPLKLEFVLTASLGPQASLCTVRFPAVLSDVLLSVDRPGTEPIVIPLSPGERSPAIDVRAFTQRHGDRPAVDQATAISPPGALDVAWRYIRLGFVHIVPHGIDHAVFVLGLFLLTPRVYAVLWQITAFTIAHTVTLTLATLHLVAVPSSIVEPAIALTIGFIAVENLFVRKVHPWRPVIAFVFGLVHGLGFASGLMEVGLPTGQLAAAIASFSVGVELGHLTVLLGALACLAPWRERLWYRRRISQPLSAIIGLVAVFWLLQRL